MRFAIQLSALSRTCVIAQMQWASSVWHQSTVTCRMGSNLAVLLLNKLLLSFWSFKQPVLLTFLHMASGGLLTWGLWGANLLTIQRIQSTAQLVKIAALSLVFALAVLSANVSLKFLAVSMNQAIGAATPVFAAMFAFILQGAPCCPPPLRTVPVGCCCCRGTGHRALPVLRQRRDLIRITQRRDLIRITQL